MSKKALVPINILAVGTQPVGKYAGDIYFDTITSTLRVFDGTVWIEIMGGNTSTPTLQIDGGAPSSYYGGTPNVDGGTPVSSFTSSYDGGTP